MSEIKECDCCEYETEVRSYKVTNQFGSLTEHWFCEICANTYLATAVASPEKCPDDRLYKSVAYIGNLILDEIKKGYIKRI